jgi:hypothetical protein
LRCLCGVAAAIAVFASITGLRRRAGIGWAVAGLALGGAFALSLAWNDPAAAVAVTILTTVAAFTVTEWR